MAIARTWTGVTRALGITSGPKAIRCCQGHAARLGLDTGHLPPTRHPAPGPLPPGSIVRPEPTAAEMAEVAARVTTWTQLITGLGYIPSGYRYRKTKALAAELGTEVSHFRGRGWNTAGLRPGGALRAGWQGDRAA